MSEALHRLVFRAFDSLSKFFRHVGCTRPVVLTGQQVKWRARCVDSLGGQREIVIDRLLALDTDELDLEQVKWVVLMVLSSQPGQELAYARMEDLVFDVPHHDPH